LTDKKILFLFRLVLFGRFWFQWLQFSYSQPAGMNKQSLVDNDMGTFDPDRFLSFYD